MQPLCNIISCQLGWTLWPAPCGSCDCLTQVQKKKAEKIWIGKRSPLLVDPSNPFGCRSLFLAGFKEGITKAELSNAFGWFGKIEAVRLKTGKKLYGFVQFAEADAAARALEFWQGSTQTLSSKPLVVQYTISSMKSAISSMENQEAVLAEAREAERLKRSKIECYFWRTTGCHYGIECWWLHVPSHKGVALKQ